MAKTVRDPYKTMFKGVTSFKKKDGMHRPEGAGNFDNMDDEIVLEVVVVQAEQPSRLKKGLIWYDTDATGQSISSTVNIATKTSAYTLVNTDVVILGNGTFTLTLPTAVGISGKQYRIKNIGTGTITVDGDGSETIDGATTAVLSIQDGSIDIISDGSNWRIL